MLKITHIFIFTSVICSGCALNTESHVNSSNNVQQISPSNLKENSAYYSTVTRPGYGNDFPVTYRVQISDQSDRVRSIDRPTLVQPSFIPSSSIDANF